MKLTRTLMRIILTVLVLIFNLQSLTKADDIRDFLIENVSIDDSLLNYFSKDEIDNKKYFLFESKKWATFLNISSSYEIYHALQITFDNEDHKYSESKNEDPKKEQPKADAKK